jgi:hypothetical protein
MKLRQNYAPYIERVEIFLEALLAQLEPLQFQKGGSIIAMQVGI